MTNQDTLYWIWLAEKCGVASKQFDSLIEKYADPFDIYRLTDEETERLCGLNDWLKVRLCDKSLENAYDIMKSCRKSGTEIICYGDPRYPERLRSTEDPPILLYCKGKLPDLNSLLCVGIVGTRSMSEYGKQSAYRMAYELSAAGICVVSGMALGIDGVAACGALAAGGSTVAVLGCGIDTVYPKQHTKLMREISSHGAVLTEYPPKEPPHGYNFPKRNRIISGLCQGLLVIEGAERSGALITARIAAEQGREIFALPGKISDDSAAGPNELIRGGAFPVLSSADILGHYEFLYGDVLDGKRLEKSMKHMPPISSALEKYGLKYALVPKKVPEEPKQSQASVQRQMTEKSVNGVGKVQTSAAKTPTAPQAARGDESEKALASLDEKTRSVFEKLPIDKAISPDMLCADGMSVSEVITALTMLELCGLVSSLPGGIYMRK